MNRLLIKWTGCVCTVDVDKTDYYYILIITTTLKSKPVNNCFQVWWDVWSKQTPSGECQIWVTDWWTHSHFHYALCSDHKVWVFIETLCSAFVKNRNSGNLPGFECPCTSRIHCRQREMFLKYHWHQLMGAAVVLKITVWMAVEHKLWSRCSTIMMIRTPLWGGGWSR